MIQQIEGVQVNRQAACPAILQELERGSSLIIEGHNLAVDHDVAAQLAQRRDKDWEARIQGLLIARP